jgi:hypothetical protein
MSRIDTKHVLLGGVAAAIILNACDWVINNYITANLWILVAHSRNVDTDLMNGPSALATTIVVDCLMGFLLAWLYAAIRPRLGRGPGTAIIAAFVVFGVANLQMATFAAWFQGWDLFIRSAALQLVALVAAALAAGWIYREAGDVD